MINENIYFNHLFNIINEKIITFFNLKLFLV